MVTIDWIDLKRAVIKLESSKAYLNAALVIDHQLDFTKMIYSYFEKGIGKKCARDNP